MKKLMKKGVGVVMGLILAGVPAAYAASKDIVDTAKSAGQFTTLVKALGQAGLVDTLKADGPFTVFAPTDEAFAKIPTADLNALMADREKLATVLKYHVVAGNVKAADVKQLSSAETLTGGSVKIHSSSAGVKIDGAKVVTPDVAATNGTIHVIDQVLMP